MLKWAPIERTTRDPESPRTPAGFILAIVCSLGTRASLLSDRAGVQQPPPFFGGYNGRLSQPQYHRSGLARRAGSNPAPPTSGPKPRKEAPITCNLKCTHVSSPALGRAGA